MDYFYDRVNWGHVVCPLYRGCTYLEVSIIGGSTVLHLHYNIRTLDLMIVFVRVHVMYKS